MPIAARMVGPPESNRHAGWPSVASARAMRRTFFVHFEVAHPFRLAILRRMISAGIELAGGFDRAACARGRLAEARFRSRPSLRSMRAASLRAGERRAACARGALEALASRVALRARVFVARGVCARAVWAEPALGFGVSDARTAARGLPALRGLWLGAIGWCMAELVLGSRLRRAMASSRGWRSARPCARCESTCGAEERASSCPPPPERARSATASGSGGNRVEPEDLEMVTLSFTVSQQDAWLFEWTRRFAAHAQKW